MSPEIAGYYSQEAANQPRSRNNLPLIALVGCVVGFACLCCAVPLGLLSGVGIIATIFEGNEVSESSVETLAIEDPDNVNLVIDNPIGEVIINGEADTNEIRVEITRRASGLTEDRARNALDDLEVTVERSGNEYRIIVNDPDEEFFENLAGSSSDLNITVPNELNIDAESNVGAVRVRNVTTRDRMDIQSDVGQIEFEGVLSPGGRHTLQTDVGSIDVTVLPGSVFALEVETDTGDVDIDFDHGDDTCPSGAEGPDIEIACEYAYEQGRDIEGRLSVQSSTGSIDIRDRD
jgi:hypothetical protein